MRAGLSMTGLVVLIASCGGTAGGSATGQAATSASAGASEPPQEAPETAATSEAPRATAPPELQGTWQATISTGEDVSLELRPTGYTVDRAGTVGSGSIEVEGDTVVFSSARCELGSGQYRWSIDGETLTFTPLEPRDPCANRIIFLEGAAYTRAE